MKKVLFLILAAVLIVGAGITGLVASANVAGTAEKTGETAAAESDPTPNVDPISGKLNYLTRQDLTDALDKAVELYFAKDERYLPKADDHSIKKFYVYEGFLEIGEIEELLDADRDVFLDECYYKYKDQFYKPVLSCTVDLLMEKLDQRTLSVNTASSFETYSDFFSGVYPPNIIYFSATADLNGYANLNEYVSKLLRAGMNKQGRFGFSDKERIPVTVDRHVSDMISIDLSLMGLDGSCCWHTDGKVAERVYPSGHVGEVMKAMRAKYFDSLLERWAERGTWDDNVVRQILFENTVEKRNISTQKPS